MSSAGNSRTDITETSSVISSVTEVTNSCSDFSELDNALQNLRQEVVTTESHSSQESGNSTHESEELETNEGLRQRKS